MEWLNLAIPPLPTTYHTERCSCRSEDPFMPLKSGQDRQMFVALKCQGCLVAMSCSRVASLRHVVPWTVLNNGTRGDPSDADP